ncbi:unnamed protein product, partial [Amoebophrya sp. A25]|eukprot:GSA25T00019231001.1
MTTKDIFVHDQEEQPVRREEHQVPVQRTKFTEQEEGSLPLLLSHHQGALLGQHQHLLHISCSAAIVQHQSGSASSSQSRPGAGTSPSEKNSNSQKCSKSKRPGAGTSPSGKNSYSQRRNEGSPNYISRGARNTTRDHNATATDFSKNSSAGDGGAAVEACSRESATSSNHHCNTKSELDKQGHLLHDLDVIHGATRRASTSTAASSGAGGPIEIERNIRNWSRNFYKSCHVPTTSTASSTAATGTDDLLLSLVETKNYTSTPSPQLLSNQHGTATASGDVERRSLTKGYFDAATMDGGGGANGACEVLAASAKHVEQDLYPSLSQEDLEDLYSSLYQEDLEDLYPTLYQQEYADYPRESLYDQESRPCPSSSSKEFRFSEHPSDKTEEARELPQGLTQLPQQLPSEDLQHQGGQPSAVTTSTSSNSKSPKLYRKLRNNDNQVRPVQKAHRSLYSSSSTRRRSTTSTTSSVPSAASGPCSTPANTASCPSKATCTTSRAPCSPARDQVDAIDRIMTLIQKQCDKNQASLEPEVDGARAVPQTQTGQGSPQVPEVDGVSPHTSQTTGQDGPPVGLETGQGEAPIYPNVEGSHLPVHSLHLQHQHGGSNRSSSSTCLPGPGIIAQNAGKHDRHKHRPGPPLPPILTSPRSVNANEQLQQQQHVIARSGQQLLGQVPKNAVTLEEQLQPQQSQQQQATSASAQQEPNDQAVDGNINAGPATSQPTTAPQQHAYIFVPLFGPPLQPGGQLLPQPFMHCPSPISPTPTSCGPASPTACSSNMGTARVQQQPSMAVPMQPVAVMSTSNMSMQQPMMS